MKKNKVVNASPKYAHNFILLLPTKGTYKQHLEVTLLTI